MKEEATDPGGITAICLGSRSDSGDDPGIWVNVQLVP